MTKTTNDALKWLTIDLKVEEYSFPFLVYELLSTEVTEVKCFCARNFYLQNRETLKSSLFFF